MASKAARKYRVALVGDVALDVLVPYFREEGFEVYVPAGFGTWPQELLDKDSPLNRFKPDVVFNVNDYDAILSKEVDGYLDERMMKLAATPYSLKGIRALIEELEYCIALGAGRVKKVIALDADETLWRGVIGEDGEESLLECREFQKGLLRLKEKGAILVLLSKNESSERFIPANFTLRDEDFSVRKINWRSKPQNLAEACEELNLGLDSVVFIDDNAAEREQMRAMLPEVAIAPWRGWRDDNSTASESAILLRRLETYAFADIGKTAEDSLRTSDYANEILRGNAYSSFANKADYLKSLELKVRPDLAKPDDLARLEQMAQKTNQFNATTIRRDMASFATLLEDDSKRVFVFRASDKFGEQGLVCYIVVDLTKKRITDFVMSCRAMSRTLEYFALDYVEKSLGFHLEIDFEASSKNKPFSDFLSTGPNGETFYICEREDKI